MSNAFGARKSTVVNAMQTATAEWAQSAIVQFVYDASQDSNCTATNTSVTFDVRPVAGQPYLARAFFPSFDRGSRNILIDDQAFSSSLPLPGVLRHEVGHGLGWRHEQTRPEAGQCYEDSSWRGVTPYDRGSVMHYPQCGGTNSSFASLSQLDREGAAQLYGSRVYSSPSFPGGCGVLRAGRGLGRNQGISSCDGRFYFVHQLDGNLVLYQSGQPIWASNTYGQPGYGAYMQGDGNLVIYSGLGRALWSTGTWGNPGATLAVQNDGNVVIYRADGRPLWSTNTCCR